MVKSIGKIPQIKATQSEYKILQIGIKINQEKLDRNIKKRLVKRVKMGMIAEVKNLRFPKKGNGLSWQRLDDLGLEYRFVSKFLRNQLTKEELFDKLFLVNRQYSKRQATWFKRDKRIKWISKLRKRQKN